MKLRTRRRRAHPRRARWVTMASLMAMPPGWLIVHPEGDWYEALRGVHDDATAAADKVTLIPGELGQIDGRIRIVPSAAEWTPPPPGAAIGPFQYAAIAGRVFKLDDAG